MECSIAVKAKFFRTFCVVLQLAASTAWADHTLVLVVSDNSPINELTALDIRKTYLGLAVLIEGRAVRPYRISNDAHLNEVFTQSVIAMSERSYERRLLSLTLKYGRPRPQQVTDANDLINKLEENPLAIGYLWQEDADKSSHLKIVKILWRAD